MPRASSTTPSSPAARQLRPTLSRASKLEKRHHCGRSGAAPCCAAVVSPRPPKPKRRARATRPRHPTKPTPPSRAQSDQLPAARVLPSPGIQAGAAAQQCYSPALLSGEFRDSRLDMRKKPLFSWFGIIPCIVDYGCKSCFSFRDLRLCC